jgi:hypothetical protein
MTKKYKSYKGPMMHRGIDDLKSLHPWVSTMQGDHMWSDKVDEDHTYLMESYSWSGIDLTSQKAIDEEIARRKAWNEEYVRGLLINGSYGEDIGQNEIKMIVDSFWDKSIGSQPKSSYKMIFLDHGKTKT